MLTLETFHDILTYTSLFGMLTEHPVVATRLREENRSAGGYLCIADEEVPVLIGRIGNPVPEKLGKYLEFSQEKARRLAAHPQHDLSRESRNPDANQWGGAVRAGGIIYSFSGLPEELDEAYACLVAMEEADLSFPTVEELLTRCPNVFLDPLREVILELERRND